MTQELKQEFTRKISQANKTQLIVILYEMALTYMEEGKAACEVGDRGAFRTAIRRTRGCINELLASLHFEYDMAMQFLQLYLYVNRELARADVRMRREPLQNAEKVICGLLGAYRELSTQDTDPPVMANAEAVYAGLTYDRKQLLQNLTHYDNRGFSI